MVTIRYERTASKNYQSETVHVEFEVEARDHLIGMELAKYLVNVQLSDNPVSRSTANRATWLYKKLMLGVVEDEVVAEPVTPFDGV